MTPTIEIIRLPETGFVRIDQIIGKPGDPKAQPPIPPIPAVIPIGQSTWWAWVQKGEAPKPVKIGGGITAWRAEDIRALVERLSSEDRWQTRWGKRRIRRKGRGRVPG